MKKLYEEPQMDLERFMFADVLTNSGIGGDGEVDPFPDEGEPDGVQP